MFLMSRASQNQGFAKLLVSISLASTLPKLPTIFKATQAYCDRSLFNIIQVETNIP